jgi:hypothetical protein
MMLSGSAFALPTLERLTGGSGCSSSRGGEWTTPKASDTERGDCPSERARRTPFLPSQVRATWNTPTVEDAGRNGSPEWARRWAAGETIPEPQQLRTQVLWPTPRAGETSDQTSVPGHFFGLSSAVKRGWPTPSASLHNDAEDPAERLARAEVLKAKHNNGNGAGMPLAVAAKLSQGSAWPTPAARDFKDTGTSPAEFDRNTPGLAACAGGSLNPDWVGRLMGFPDGWTSPPTDGPSAPAKRSPKASRRASRKKGTSDGRG